MNEMKEMKKMKGMKGIILTIEAFLSFLVLLSIIQLLSVNFIYESHDENTLYKFIFLSDIFETIEKGYHDELSNWVWSNTKVGNFGKMENELNWLTKKTAKKFYIAYYNRKLPDIDCDLDITIYRSIITDEGFSRIRMVLCK